MILLTSITSPLVVQRFAHQLQTAEVNEAQTPLFDRILVPIADTKQSEGLVVLASMLARSAKGRVFAVSVAQAAASSSNGNDFHTHKQLLGRVHETLQDPEAEIELIPRVALTHAHGILHTAQEENASLILMGWRGRRTFRENVLGSVLDEVIWGSDTLLLWANCHCQ
jgi:nucleotide-binding universal stress UspA family protein